MAQDKYSALWISHSRIRDFETCPRSYYLKYIYRNPKTGHKIKLMTAPLALGQVVHDVIESIQTIPTKERFSTSLIERLHDSWKKIEGKLGGFADNSIESRYKARAEAMLLRIMKDPGPLANLAVKLQTDYPSYWISDEKNIILTGKIDWMEYLPETDSVHIIDFKTGRNEEDEDSLQLPIYYLLAKRCQKRYVAKMSYWYLEKTENAIVEKPLPVDTDIEKIVLDKALAVELAVKLNRFKCKQQGGCNACSPYESIVSGRAEFVGVNSYKEDIYLLEQSSQAVGGESEII